MPKLTKYGLNSYIKAIEIFAATKFGKLQHWNSKGSKYSFRLFQKKDDTTPCAIWTVHTEHNKKRLIWSRDFQKAVDNLGVTYEEFVELIEKF